jgi:hypothetical protein
LSRFAAQDFTQRIAAGNALAWYQAKCRGLGYTYVLFYRKPLACKRLLVAQARHFDLMLQL